ncbi:MAG: HAMP domain-containing sensor histidine kinase [Schleiferiaceae bacterium]|nr:HAMP domain-containing sensor histidine kinase [Schleiferiaceae bacterium]
MENREQSLSVPLEQALRWPVGLLTAAWLGVALWQREPVPSGPWAYLLLAAGVAWIAQAALDFRARRSAFWLSFLTLFSMVDMLFLRLDYALLGPLIAGSLLVPRFALPYLGGWGLLPLLYPVYTGAADEGALLVMLGIAHLAVAYYFKSELAKRTEQEKQQKRQQEISGEKLQNQNLHLENLGRMTSHNLRAPLQGIKMLTQMMEQVEEEERQELTAKIDEGVDEMLTMVKQLSEMLKQHAEAREQTEEIALAEVWEQTQSQLQGLITSAQGELEADFSDCPVVRYPRIYLESIFLNLSSNALKYRKKDQPARLSVRSYQSDGQVLLEFRDAGRGIDMAEEGRQLFKWLRAGAGGEAQSGMGLFMTKSQVEMLGGKIMVESEPGVGSTFTVLLYQV